MEQRIWKFNLKVTDTQVLKIPVESQILTVQLQNGTPVLWALVYPDSPTEDVCIETIGTGNPISTGVDRHYISTYQLSNGLVFHVFELLTP